MKNTSTKNNFGRKGWGIIIITAVAYFFFAGTINDSLNLIVGNYSGMHGLDYNKVLSLATPAAWFGILGVVVWTVIIKKIGARILGAFTLLCAGVSFALYAVVNDYIGFLVVTSLVNFMAYGYCMTAAQVLITNWFPTKKGLALGWSTMGTNLSGAIICPLIIFFIGFFGVNGSYVGVGAIIAVTAVVWYIFVRDMPEECGCEPDNGDYDKAAFEADMIKAAAYKSPWTAGKFLRKKNIWFLSLGFGIYIIVTVSMVSQMIPRLVAGGWSQDYATTMLAAASIWGMAGSYITGWIDQKIGTKMASIIVGIVYLIACIMCCLPATNLTMYLSLFFIGIGIGGIGNLFPSMLSNQVARYDFPLLLGVANVITLILRSFTFSIFAFGMERGGYPVAYGIIAVMNVIGVIFVALTKDKKLEP